jgi:hypothetical protein
MKCVSYPPLQNITYSFVGPAESGFPASVVNVKWDVPAGVTPLIANYYVCDASGRNCQLRDLPRASLQGNSANIQVENTRFCAGFVIGVFYVQADGNQSQVAYTNVIKVDNTAPPLSSLSVSVPADCPRDPANAKQVSLTWTLPPNIIPKSYVLSLHQPDGTLITILDVPRFVAASGATQYDICLRNDRVQAGFRLEMGYFSICDQQSPKKAVTYPNATTASFNVRPQSIQYTNFRPNVARNHQLQNNGNQPCSSCGNAQPQNSFRPLQSNVNSQDSCSIM